MTQCVAQAWKRPLLEFHLNPQLFFAENTSFGPWPSHTEPDLCLECVVVTNLQGNVPGSGVEHGDFKCRTLIMENLSTLNQSLAKKMMVAFALGKITFGWP